MIAIQDIGLHKLRRRRDRLARRREHLLLRIAASDKELTHDIAEASALETALLLFDAAIIEREEHACYYKPTTGGQP
jgi:hypothetical protein